MRNLLLVWLIILPFIFNNCKKDVSKSSTVYISEDVDIAYNNASGQDLLNSATNNYFSSDNIRVHNVVGGIKKEIYNPQMDYPRNFFIYKNDSLNEYFLRIFCEADTTLLQLNKSNIDTIICTFSKSPSNIAITEVWYNGVIKWGNLPVSRKFTVIK